VLTLIYNATHIRVGINPIFSRKLEKTFLENVDEELLIILEVG
jgi:hypothetical protein